MRRPILTLLVGGIVTLTLAPNLGAQDSGDGFRFRKPIGSWSFRGGFAMPNANSDLFKFTTGELTINKGDFSSVDFGADLSFSISPRVDVDLDISFSGMSKQSEFRNFVDNNQLPIQQKTSFQRTPITVNARYYLMDRGRQISRYAWVPNAITPYVGAGVGVMNYNFEQKGDFIDNKTLAVFADGFQSGGWTPMAQALAGVEYSIGSNWALRAEARYLQASATPSSDFSGFHHIDLSGVTSSVGFFVRF